MRHPSTSATQSASTSSPSEASLLPSSSVMSPPSSTSTSALATSASLAAAVSSSSEDPPANEVVAVSNLGTAFYLFNHQAGGHKAFLRSASGEVCKPAIALELGFYRALSTQYPQLEPFVPPFKGVITIDLHLGQSVTPASPIVQVLTPPERKRVTADNSDASTPTSSSPSTPVPSHGAGSKKRRLEAVRRDLHQYSSSRSSPSASSSYSARLWRSERAAISAGSKPTKRSGGNSSGSSNTSDSGSASTPSQASTPTSAPTTSCSREYLVLEDLTRRYERPCVLDMKMGTRQHGADAPPAKVRSHSAKCAATTSLTLGLRLCGMQTYDRATRRYTLWDKHWGRQLTADGLEHALATYVTSGGELQWGVLRQLLAQVEELYAVVAATTGVRFWGASLLLIYEGGAVSTTPTPPDVRLIDFAHSQRSEQLTSPDDGLLLGLRNLSDFLRRLLSQRSEAEAVTEIETEREAEVDPKTKAKTEGLPTTE